jgi:hypothetical protein
LLLRDTIISGGSARLDLERAGRTGTTTAVTFI